MFDFICLKNEKKTKKKTVGNKCSFNQLIVAAQVKTLSSHF